MRKNWKLSLGLMLWIALILGAKLLWNSLGNPPRASLENKEMSEGPGQANAANQFESERTPSSIHALSLAPRGDLNQDICQNFHRAVCQRKGEVLDPTGTVRSEIEGEKIIMKMVKDIVQQHPDWSSEQVDETLAIQIYEPKKRGRIESAFRWVLNDMERFIDRQSDRIFNSKEKHQLKARLRATHLQLPPPASIYSDEPDLFTKNEAYYERTLDGEMRLRVGGAYVVIAKSWFNLVNTLSHELAHSIDPCEVRNIQLSFPAYDRLIACFLRKGLIETRKNRAECGANDQLSETFADWMAANIVADALTLFSTEFHSQQIVNAAKNSVRDLCAQEEQENSQEIVQGTGSRTPATELDLEFHPTPHVRIQKIFGNHPTIRSLLGCHSHNDPLNDPFAYCTFESTRNP